MTRLRILVMSLLAIGLAGFAPVAAQTPEASPVTGPIGTIASFDVDALTGPHSEVWFIRYTLAAGAAMPTMEEAGFDLVAVESGMLTVTTDTAVQVSVAGGAPTTAEAGEIVVNAGDALLLPDRAKVSAKNADDVPAVFLDLVVMSGEREVESQQTAEASGEDQQTIDEMGGIRPQMLSVGGAAFGTGPGTITIERIALDEGNTSEVQAGARAEAGTVEAGQPGLHVEDGSGYLWFEAAIGAPETMGRGTLQFDGQIDCSLMVGDGYYLAPQTTSSLAARDGEVIILRAVVTER